MRAMKYAFLVLAILVGLSTISNVAEAGSSFFLGYSHYRPYYYNYYRPYNFGYYPHFYRPYYRPYFYGPYGYGGYGGGYGGYGGYYGYGEVRLEIKPKSARVYVDGAYAGIVDDFDGWYQRLEVSPGAHKIVVREPGFAPYVEVVRALPGQDVHIKHLMLAGSDAIDPKDMVLERNERDYRDDRRPYDRYRQRDNEYDRERRRDRDRDDDDNDDDYGYQRYDQESRSLPRSGPPMAQSGNRTITMDVTPSDATVYIDGNDYGTAGGAGGELQVLLPEGTHRLEIVRPGYKTYSSELRIYRDSNDRVVVNLEKK